MSSSSQVPYPVANSAGGLHIGTSTPAESSTTGLAKTAHASVPGSNGLTYGRTNGVSAGGPATGVLSSPPRTRMNVLPPVTQTRYNAELRTLQMQRHKCSICFLRCCMCFAIWVSLIMSD